MSFLGPVGAFLGPVSAVVAPAVGSGAGPVGVAMPGHRLQSPDNPWFSWRYVRDNADTIMAALREHVTLTVAAVLIAAAVGLPLAVLAYWYRPLTGPILASSGVLYTIPSLALFALLGPYLGIGPGTVLVGLVLYALLMIVRNALAGLTGVPPDVRDAALGMGYGRFALLLRVELPLALPGILTGVRLATVSTVALTTVGVLVGHGGLGQLIIGGFNSNFHRAPVATGTLLCVALALVLDLALTALSDALRWLNDPLNWTNPGGILDRLAEHAVISAAAVALACLLAWPLGLWLGRSGRGGGALVVLSNVTLAIPTLALLTILPLTPIGIGKPATILALTVFAVPPLLATAYTGVREVDPRVREAARGMGMSGAQVLRRVELPLAVPYLAAGFRTAAVQVVATATLAALVNGGGLGQIISTGFGLRSDGQVLAGGILVAALALLVERLLAVAERLVTPAPLRRRTGRAAPAGAAGSAG